MPRRGVTVVIAQRCERAKPVGRVERVVDDLGRVDGQVGGELQVVDERGPAGEADATRNGQLRVVQREPLRGIRKRRTGPWMVPLHELGGICSVGCHAALEPSGFGAEPVERRVVG